MYIPDVNDSPADTEENHRTCQGLQNAHQRGKQRVHHTGCHVSHRSGQRKERNSRHYRAQDGQQQLKQGADLLRFGGVNSQAVDPVLIGIDRRKAGLGQQVGAQHPPRHVGSRFVRVYALAGSCDLKIHPPQPGTTPKGTNRFFPAPGFPQSQDLFHRQPQADDILPIDLRLLQRVSQQLGDSVDPRFVQRHFLPLLRQGQFILLHGIKLLPYLMIP